MDSKEDASTGSVVAVVLIVDGIIYSASVGDVEAFIARAGIPLPLSTVHNGNNPIEASRIEAVGGTIYRGRLAHPLLNPEVLTLGITRAVGDMFFKYPTASGLIATPDIQELEITVEDEFIVIATDGVWDCLSHTDALKIVWDCLRQSKTLEEVATELVTVVLGRGSRDNVSAVVISLAKPSIFEDVFYVAT